MANIGTFTADKDGFSGMLRTLTLNIKVKLIPNDRPSDNAPDYRLLTATGQEIGAGWNKITRVRHQML